MVGAAPPPPMLAPQGDIEGMSMTDENGAGATGETRAFGRALRDQFFLDPDGVYLNHGAFGAISRPVAAAQERWRQRIEEQPSRFMRLDLPDLLRETATTLGVYVGARGEDIVFVDNATTAINAVLRSLVLMPGDEVIATSHTYGAVLRTLEFVCDRADARLVIADLPFPTPGPDAVLEAFVDRLTPRTRLAVIDHITSKTALILPIKQMIAECKDRGIRVLVDGAHAPGMIPNLRIENLGCDWYAANCHKWIGAPRGAAFLWTAPEHQPALRPTTISHGIGDGYTAAFDWPGTKDFTPWLTIPDALAFRESLGGDQAIWDYCHPLVCEMGLALAARLGSEICGPESMTGFCVTIRFGSSSVPLKQATPDALREVLYQKGRIEADIQAFQGISWMRLSAYSYTELSELNAFDLVFNESAN